MGEIGKPQPLNPLNHQKLKELLGTAKLSCLSVEFLVAFSAVLLRRCFLPAQPLARKSGDGNYLGETICESSGGVSFTCWFKRQGRSWNDPYKPSPMVSFRGIPFRFIPKTLKETIAIVRAPSFSDTAKSLTWGVSNERLPQPFSQLSEISGPSRKK